MSVECQADPIWISLARVGCEETHLTFEVE